MRAVATVNPSMNPPMSCTRSEPSSRRPVGGTVGTVPDDGKGRTAPPGPLSRRVVRDSPSGRASGPDVAPPPGLAGATHRKAGKTVPRQQRAGRGGRAHVAGGPAPAG